MAARSKHIYYWVQALVTVFVPTLQTEGQIRLAGGSSRCSGRVEVYYNSSWGTVCDDSWDVLDGEVVCRQLGCGTVVSAPTNAKFGEGTGEIWLDNVLCSGNESSLTQCEHNGFGRHDCNHGDDAGVVCSDEIQLVGPGSSRCSGRVEVRHNSSWGTVCDDNWDMSDAQVVCRHLKCGTALMAITEAKFGQGSDPIWLDDVGCSGNESSLLQCQNGGFGPHYCNHDEDAGVICSGRLPKPSISLTPQEVRWGQSVTVTCSIIGLSGGTFSLRRSQQDIQTSPSNLTTFRLSPVTFNNAGPYNCQYQKKVSGRILTSPRSESLTLHVSVVLPEPSLCVSLASGEQQCSSDTVLVTRGERFVLSCSVHSDLPEGHFILTSSGSSSSVSEPAVNHSASFHFPQSQSEHQGQYHCVYQVTGAGRTYTSETATITVIIKLPSVLLVALSVGGGLLLIALVLLLLLLLHKKRSRSKQTEINLQSHNSAANQYIEDRGDNEGDYASVEAHAACADEEKFATKVNESRIEEVYDYVKMDDEEQKEEDDMYVTVIEVGAEDLDNIYENT